MTTAVLYVRIPDWLHDQIKAIADEEGQTMAQIARIAILEFSQRQNRKRVARKLLQ